MIDYARTTENMKLLNKSVLAKRLDVTPALISLISTGKYTKSLEAPKAALVLQTLRDLNMLVEVPDCGEVQSVKPC